MGRVISDRWREAVSLGEGIRPHHVLWPPSFRGAPPHARVPANALAALMFGTAICQAFLWFYWQGTWRDEGERYSALWLTTVTMAMPVLLMRLALAHALDDRRGVWPRLVAVMAGILTVVTTPLFLLGFAVAFDDYGRYCPGPQPTNPDRLSGGEVPTAVMVALAAGSAASWLMWACSRRQARPIDLYRVWLTTIIVTVMVTLAPSLRSADTCLYGG
ncbi:hypothetical protein [Streptomyces ossamyceticus]|uniref:hypothetical protein n=1 Tax=Streptomyces ossamyceticus TaxID=249581 RepID=UPI000B148447|nr:hypothetical protein [Streptomyces ossamyceticus]